MNKENRSLQDKLRRIFKINKTNPENINISRDFVLTDEILKDLSKSTVIPTRIRTMKDLSERILHNRLDDNDVEKLWCTIQDLFLKDYPTETRHAAFNFLHCIIKGQFNNIYIMRAKFFRFIKNNDCIEDTAQCVDLLCTLTSNGKEVEHFEEEIGSFLLNWLPDITRVGKLEEYLNIVNNIIKFNSPHLDEFIMKGYVKHFCTLCCNSNQLTIVNLSLEILSSIVAYSILPHESLPQFVGTLCRTVTVNCYCQTSWNIMRNLLGTHMGHNALFIMCSFLQEPNLKSDSGLMRGCVFFISMALWGTRPMQNLRCPPNSVLPSILCAVKCNHPTVAYEVILGLQKLINERGLELFEPTWDIILDILLIIIKQIDSASTDEVNILTKTPLHEILNKIENYIKVGTFNGSIRKFLNVIHECSQDRPESSILNLIQYLSNSLRPIEYAWLNKLYDLLTNYFRNDVRTNIRLKVLDVLADVIQLYGSEYEDELIERIVIPHTKNIANDNNIVVRSAVAKLLVNICMDYNSKIIIDILDILEKLLMRPFDQSQTEQQTTNEMEFSDIRSLVSGLIQVFSKKIHLLPSLHAIKIFKMLIQYLERHYQQIKTFQNCNQIRYLIFDCILKMRADSSYHLGYPNLLNNGQLTFSRYLCITYKSQYQLQINSPQLQSPVNERNYKGTSCEVTYMSIKGAFNLIIQCLNTEKDWEVLKLVLQELPNLLQNKSLILSGHGNNDLNNLVNVLCSMLQDKSMNLPESLNIKVSRLEFQVAIVSIIASFASYNNSLDQIHQQKLINTLTRITGTDPRNSKQCINALMICTIDMREAVMKLLQDILLKLSKISATIVIAMPILEFLSTLSQLPSVYTNFVPDQYMAVFAIALPYTNPIKYNYYIVSLAYHVISVWFTKCRLPYRKDFVKFILSGLQTNVMLSFQESFSQFKLGFTSTMNQDSSDRKRSSSLTEQSSRRKIRLDNKNAPLHQAPRDKTVLTFYEDLNETCIDLMARYTYSPCSALPTRLPSAEFLLNGGISKSWMIGNKLITITTSGCTEKVVKRGVCDKCWNLCNLSNKITKYSNSNSSSNDSKDSPFTSRQNSLNDKQNVNNNNTSSTGGASGSASGSNNNNNLNDDLTNNKIDNENVIKLQQLLLNNNSNLNNSNNSNVDDNNKNYQSTICSCWCQGWAEILIRRPTGNVSWVMKVQNQISFKQLIYEFPLNEMSTLYMPTLNLNNSNNTINLTVKENIEKNNIDDDQSVSQTISILDSPLTTKHSSLSRQSSHDSADEELESIYDDQNTKSRNPVRRSNSSPEMANWKNPFIIHQKLDNIDNDNNQDNHNITKQYTKDVRVSCEAIPEEISGLGTTPPNNNNNNNNCNDLKLTSTIEYHHPSLLTCHSYPGSSPPQTTNDNQQVQKSSQTVPASPNFNLNNNPTNFQTKTSTTNVASGGSSSKDLESFDKIFDRPNNLPNLVNLAPLTTAKPPQSPTQTSPRLSRHLSQIEKESVGHVIQKSSSSSILEKNTKTLLKNIDKNLNQSDLIQKRDRLHTVSVMSTSTRSKVTEKLRQQSSSMSSSSSITTTTTTTASGGGGGRKLPKEMLKSGLNPSFIFLQLYHNACFGPKQTEVPLYVHSTKVIDCAINVLDLIYPYETHKIGIVYINNGQTIEIDILKNVYGCIRYLEFLQNLGNLIRLADTDPRMVYLGGLDHTGQDGNYTYIHQDDLVCINFHVATLMPNKDTDPNCTAKKKHIGNDNVLIVYNNSGEDYDINTIKSQVTLAYIIIHPLDYNSNKVVVKAKPRLLEIIGCDPIIVSDQSVSILVRQLALHADLAATVLNSLRSHSTDPYASNWLERLRKLKNLREKVITEIKGRKDAQKGFSEEKDIVEDFTDFT